MIVNLNMQKHKRVEKTIQNQQLFRKKNLLEKLQTEINELQIKIEKHKPLLIDANPHKEAIASESLLCRTK